MTSGKAKCVACGGWGYKDSILLGKITCPYCQGTGIPGPRPSPVQPEQRRVHPAGHTVRMGNKEMADRLQAYIERIRQSEERYRAMTEDERTPEVEAARAEVLAAMQRFTDAFDQALLAKILADD